MSDGQLDFFGGAAPAPIRPTRSAEGRRSPDWKLAGQLGQARSMIRALEADGSFSGRAMAYVVEYLTANGQTSGEVLTDAMKAAGILPPDDRAFGSVFARLAKTGRIEVSGFCVRKKGHGTAGGRIWKLGAVGG